MIETTNQSPWDKYWNCFIFEAIGSFFIVFAIQLAHAYQYGVFAIGVSFFLSVFIAANVSGAHLNSAVTLCIYLNDKKTKNANTPIEKYYGYVIAQIVGGTLAGVLVNGLFGEEAIVSLDVNHISGSAAFVYEMLYTGLLCFMVSILCDENYPKTEPALIGLLVAGVIFIEANAIGAWTGGVVNPSIGTSLILAKSLSSSGSSNFNRITLYIAAPCTGAIIAHALYQKYVKPFFAKDQDKEVLLKSDEQEMI